MRFIRQLALAMSPFVFGLILGLVVVPSESNATPRPDYTGISPMADLDCARRAPIHGLALLPTMLQIHLVDRPVTRTCAPQADLRPAAALAPKVAFGKARAHFVWGR